MANTSKSPGLDLLKSRQARYWILTIPRDSFDPTKDPTKYGKRCVYVQGQLESGANTGFEHYQLYVCFDRAVRLAHVISQFPRSHAEPTRSDAAREYCVKSDTRIGEPFVFGKLPLRRNSKTDWESVWESAINGDLESIPASVRVQSYGALRKIHADYMECVALDRTCTVFWGATGTGKSRRAWEEASLDAYSKSPTSKFWDGYRGQNNVVIDEFRGDIGISHLLRWLDRYPVSVEIKGSAVPLRSSKFWITSNLHPSEWYPSLDQETLAALLRRLSITEFKKLINT